MIELIFSYVGAMIQCFRELTYAAPVNSEALVREQPALPMWFVEQSIYYRSLGEILL